MRKLARPGFTASPELGEGEVIEAGALAGLLGGVAMALFAGAYATHAGRGFWAPVEAVAATVVGTRVYELGARAALIGAVLHLLTSMTFGVLFASMTPRDLSPLAAVPLGMFAGVAILVLMSLLVLPTYDWTGATADIPHIMWGSVPGRRPVPIAFVAHMIYGLGLAMAPGFRRRFG
jgi:hypothetical protein